ncbi:MULTISPECIES: hypothetical protein [unclassified Pseudomonas]|nr:MULTISPECIES: hypothetical protein [unclassified Pseudomonas]
MTIRMLIQCLLLTIVEFNTGTGESVEVAGPHECQSQDTLEPEN